MFSDTLPHVHASSYDASFEDFASADASRLDTWVFERVEEMLHSAASDPGGALDTAMRGDRCVFFLHLLGIDTNGHAHRPHSASYLRNLALVDRGVRRLTEQFNAHFGDNDTAFIFTSDHGMAAAGMHGDGDPANTRTPLIAWGAGVRSPEDVRGECCACCGGPARVVLTHRAVTTALLPQTVEWAQPQRRLRPPRGLRMPGWLASTTAAAKLRPSQLQRPTLR